MKIVLVTKFPPLEGGMSGRGYFLAQTLARRGHKVTVVTNGNHASANERVQAPLSELRAQVESIEGLTVRFAEDLNEDYYRHPMSTPAASGLASMAVAASEEIDADVIYGAYLEPYGVAAHLAGSLTGVPVVLNHAGSDVGRLLAARDLGHVLVRILQAHHVVTVPNHLLELLRHGCTSEKLHALKFPLPLPASTPEDVDPIGSRPRRMAVVGKLSLLTPLTALADLASRHDYELEIIGEPAWSSSAPPDLADVAARPHVAKRGFVWPWRLGDILKSTRVISFFANPGEKLLTHTGALPLEALAAGAMIGIPERRAATFSIPPEGYCSDLDELESLIERDESAIQSRVDAGRAALAELLGPGSPVIPFPTWVDGVEEVLSTAAAERVGNRPRRGASCHQSFRPSAIAARASVPITHETALVRRLPMRIVRNDAQRWEIEIRTVGFVARRFLVNSVGKAILQNADGISPLAVVAKHFEDTDVIRVATSMVKLGLITPATEISAFDAVPALEPSTR